MPQLLAPFLWYNTQERETRRVSLTSAGNHSASKLRGFQMIKTTLAALAAAPLFAGAAMAGPYVNVEANSGFTGSNYSGTNIDTHVGYEGALGATAGWYVQAGATIVAPDGGASDTVPSGKAGISAGLTEQLSAYGEVSFVGSGVAGVDRSYGTKAGLKFTF
jgi:hypothetical protein